MGTSVRDEAPRRLTPAPAQSAAQTAFLFATVECAAPLRRPINFGTEGHGRLTRDPQLQRARAQVRLPSTGRRPFMATAAMKVAIGKAHSKGSRVRKGPASNVLG